MLHWCVFGWQRGRRGDQQGGLSCSLFAICLVCILIISWLSPLITHWICYTNNCVFLQLLTELSLNLFCLLPAIKLPAASCIPLYWHHIKKPRKGGAVLQSLFFLILPSPVRECKNHAKAVLSASHKSCSKRINMDEGLTRFLYNRLAKPAWTFLCVCVWPFTDELKNETSVVSTYASFVDLSPFSMCLFPLSRDKGVTKLCLCVPLSLDLCRWGLKDYFHHCPFPSSTYLVCCII